MLLVPVPVGPSKYFVIMKLLRVFWLIWYPRLSQKFMFPVIKSTEFVFDDDDSSFSCCNDVHCMKSDGSMEHLRRRPSRCRTNTSIVLVIWWFIPPHDPSFLLHYITICVRAGRVPMHPPVIPLQMLEKPYSFYSRRSFMAFGISSILASRYIVMVIRLIPYQYRLINNGKNTTILLVPGLEGGAWFLLGRSQLLIGCWHTDGKAHRRRFNNDVEIVIVTLGK